MVVNEGLEVGVGVVEGVGLADIVGDAVGDEVACGKGGLHLEHGRYPISTAWAASVNHTLFASSMLFT